MTSTKGFAPVRRANDFRAFDGIVLLHTFLRWPAQGAISFERPNGLAEGRSAKDLHILQPTFSTPASLPLHYRTFCTRSSLITPICPPLIRTMCPFPAQKQVSSGISNPNAPAKRTITAEKKKQDANATYIHPPCTTSLPTSSNCPCSLVRRLSSTHLGCPPPGGSDSRTYATESLPFLECP